MYSQTLTDVFFCNILEGYQRGRRSALGYSQMKSSEGHRALTSHCMCPLRWIPNKANKSMKYIHYTKYVNDLVLDENKCFFNQYQNRDK